MRRSLVLSIAVLSSAAAWADAPSPGNGAQGGASSQTQPIYRSIWKIEDSGAIAHLQTGLVCDAATAGVHRLNVIAFKPNGLDVGCNYATVANDLTITEYITRRASQTLADDLAEARAELLRRFDDLSLLPDSSSKDFAHNASWLKEVYARPRSRFREGIWVADISGWTLEYRVTYLPEAEPVAFVALAAIWARAQASAGAQLARCAKISVPVRDGSPMVDKDEIRQSLLMVSLLGAAPEDPKVQKLDQRRLTWCAEDMLQGTEASMMLWHAVFDDGSDASADRITAMTVDETPALDSAPDALMEIVDKTNAKGTDQNARWIVKLTHNAESAIYAIYNGRPPAAELAKVADAVFSGKAKSLGAYSHKNGKINIILPPEN